MIGIDTFSWYKILLLRKENKWRGVMEDLIKGLDCFITVEGKKEFEYRFPNELNLLDYITILPVIESEKYKYFLQFFDPTDASLLEYVDKRNYRIITEDRPMIAEGVTTKRNIVFLIDFFYEMYKTNSFFSTNEIYKLVKLFRKWKNISKKKEKQILERLKI
ncbi:MAG: hypothetical protein HeimC3_36090 [Candidatus Heimdallarchaeota archaeon LC_3]|nr:MAG: hypothetical protein HeimC3_36090 [Candidatus Heimdallarchaeota archaeon LC_3]